MAGGVGALASLPLPGFLLPIFWGVGKGPVQDSKDPPHKL